MVSLEKSFDTVRSILNNLPDSWVTLTTHRLDIYDESQAKFQFLQQLHELTESQHLTADSLEALPTAYDYIRLGHQLSSVLEWLIAQINNVPTEQVITFTSKTMPVLALLRKNALSEEKTYVYYNTESSPLRDLDRLQGIYGYQVNLHKVDDISQVAHHDDGSVIFVTHASHKDTLAVNNNVDVTVNIHPDFGSTMVIHNADITDIVKDVQHVRRRETIAMTPANCLNLLQEMVNDKQIEAEQSSEQAVNLIHQCIQANTGSTVAPLIASSGLSIQYAILMGLVEHALTEYSGKRIQIVIPPNCYGGTNDQARRIGDLIDAVEIVDLLVDGGQDMVSSLDVVLKAAADNDCVPIVLAEIPTNPRVEVPDMVDLGSVLSAQRTTQNGEIAVAPVFMVDQTFCPNVKLLHAESELSKVKIISFSSGSKFPSGGRCIAGYCAANEPAKALQLLIAKHLELSDNAAIANQLNTLAEHMPSMPERIEKAFVNTRALVEYVQRTLPQAKINFVSEQLAEQGFTPSVFSLDLPSVGETDEAREENKRDLNQKLIDLMIGKHPDDCKYCVSYGQLKGTYWTIPATSTQGTTKETDKDYIVRVALSPQSDVTAISNTFTEFCRSEQLI